MTETVAPAGRPAQRRRTRRAIVEATSQLLLDGAEPSIAEIAAAADVSRRTIYAYFPTVDQLLLDAALAHMSTDVDKALAALDGEDARAGLEQLVDAVFASMAASLPLGRKIIKLTVDTPAVDGDGPRRGYRRIEWIERAIEPVRRDLGRARFERLVSSLAMVIGWEPFIVLTDVRGLDVDHARKVSKAAALALLDAALAE